MIVGLIWVERIEEAKANQAANISDVSLSAIWIRDVFMTVGLELAGEDCQASFSDPARIMPRTITAVMSTIHL